MHPNIRGRHIHRHRFGNRNHRLHNKFFVPHHHWGHRVFPPHRGFFFGHHVIGVAPSAVIIWSNPGIAHAFNVPPAAHDTNEVAPPERPLISIMLRHRRDLRLSPQQIDALEELRHTYQRKAIRHQADVRIAELDLQRLLRPDPVDVELVRAKLETIQNLKVELRLARITAIAEGKALLSPDQREKLSALLGEAQYSELTDEPSDPPMQD
jgi:Spy/CpxP family protein refolding chaperone